MPGVALLPNNPPPNTPTSKWMSPLPQNTHQKSSSSSSFAAPAAHNGSHRNNADISIADIKNKAKEGVNKEARGVSAITLIKTARTQILSAKDHEARGDLRSALGSYIKAAMLAKMAMDSPEYKGGVIRKELNDLLANDAKDISARTNAVEEKLKTIEKAQAAEAKETPAGGSIADRLRALQDNGLSLGQTKLRDHNNLPTPPTSPNFPSVPQYSNPQSIAPSTSTSSQSIHALVSPSSFGPPSPSSTPSSSPTNASVLNNYEISGFNQAFPSIDELDEDPAFSLPSLPSAPSGIPGSISISTSTSNNTYTNGKPAYGGSSNGSKELRSEEPSPSPLASFRNFTVPIERPSSTPVSPSTNHAFSSRPPSPSPNNSNLNNLSNNLNNLSLNNPNNNNFNNNNSSSSNANNRSTAPHRPSGLSNGVIGIGASSSSASNSNSNPNSGAPKAKTPIPVKNTAFPRELQAYLRDHNVLVIDVRTRAEFDREHIKGNAVVCIEPFVLMRDNVDAETLENSMAVGPRQEHNVFMNRDKFDLVAVYDASSTSFTSASSSASSSSAHADPERTPLSVLVRVIHERAFRKMLKRMPMMLVGGLDAWKRELGEADLVRGPAYGLGYAPGQMEIQKPVPVGAASPLAQSFSAGGAGVSVNVTGQQQHEVWTPSLPGQQATGGYAAGGGGGAGDYPHQHRVSMSLDQSGHSRSPADTGYNGVLPSNGTGSDREREKALQRRPAVLRPSSSSISFSRSMNDTTPPVSIAYTGSTGFVSGSSHISYPQFSRHISSPPASASASTSISSPLSSSGIINTNPFSAPPTPYDIASPPQASINPSHLSRRRSDYIDQSQEALSGVGYGVGIGAGGASSSSSSSSRPPLPLPPIDYPDLSLGSPSSIPRPPPVAAPPSERQDNRPRVQHAAGGGPFAQLTGGAGSSVGVVNGVNGGSAMGPKPPRIQSDYPVLYWPDMNIGTSGLKNLGNTCYMNAPIQCLSATVPFSRFFTEGRWKSAVNYTNPLGSKGKLTGAFAKLLHEMWGGDLPYLTPTDFRRSICQLKAQYIGSEQHDSQEFLSFLIDGIHEDLNRIIAKPTYTPSPEEEAELERLPPQIASDREWRTWRSRNDSLIVDFFQGQFRNRLECLTCHTTSTTYNVFSILQLPIPHARSGKVPIERCLDAFFNEEVLEKDDAWDCPKCKTKRRASKKLSLARLPPILMIHLKRFEANGRFSDKVDTFVEFPMKSLDLTNYMPPPLPPGVDRSQLNGGQPMSLEDPRTQLPPYRYDLYGVTNHYGFLSSGHYTAFIASRGGWMYCDDSSVKPVDPKQVVNQKAYVLFYKRVRS